MGSSPTRKVGALGSASGPEAKAELVVLATEASAVPSQLQGQQKFKEKLIKCELPCEDYF